MGLEHMKTPPVSQGENQNYCWAASLSWWLKAVNNRSVSMDELIEIYDRWVNWESETSFGALKPEGLTKLVYDQRWHLDYDPMKSDKITLEYLTGILKRGPVMIAYNEPAVSGYHMNVIVAAAGIGDVMSGLVVMDPNYQSFQIRNLQYYKNYWDDLCFIYKRSPSKKPTYAVYQSY